MCGKLKLVCFDKTGTLTEEGLSLWGIIPCHQAILDQPTTSVQNLDRESLLVSCLAACHSLITIDGQLSGDPLDLKMFEATGWELVEAGSSENENYDQMMPTMVRPKSADLEDSWKLALEIGIIRQFSFTSNLARMSVIAKKLRSSQFMVLVKGAPERLEPRGGRYVLIIHFYVEWGQKMIQFNIQFKFESKIFIQKIIQFKKFKNY